jgi:hypothetical protein
MRKLLTFLIALGAVVFATVSPVSAQVGGLGFPGPGLGHSFSGGYTARSTSTAPPMPSGRRGARFGCRHRRCRDRQHDRDEAGLLWRYRLGSGQRKRLHVCRRKCLLAFGDDMCDRLRS